MQGLEKTSPPGADPTEKQIEKHILSANDIARETMHQGQHPFGAILVDADNETILMAQGNIDTVNHAESTLARLAAEKYSPEHLWQCALYTTVEPCVMCSGTIYWANIGRLAYGMSERQLLDFTGAHAENPTMDLSCRNVFAHGQKAIKVWGACNKRCGSGCRTAPGLLAQLVSQEISSRASAIPRRLGWN